MAIVADRGLVNLSLSGQLETALGLAGSERSEGDSPGCWTLINIVFKSGVISTPVISQPFGPIKKRRNSFVAGSDAYMALFGNLA